MPDWHVLLGDLRAVQVVAWIVAAVLLIGVVIKLWPFIKNAVAIVDALVALPAMSKQMQLLGPRMLRLETKVDGIHHETHKNDGSSIKDAVDRVERGVAGLYDEVGAVKTDVGVVKDDIQKLHTADNELRADLEATQGNTGPTRRSLRAARERHTITEYDIPNDQEVIMRTFAKWFTPERRQLVQALLASIAVLAVQFGLGTDGQWEQILVLGGAGLGALAGLLNLVNVRVADWATQGWAIVRGVIYGFATVASPALVALGLYGEDVNTQIVTGLAQTLTVLSSAIAIFANGQQQKYALAA